jgi:hypothetical protein
MRSRRVLCTGDRETSQKDSERRKGLCEGTPFRYDPEKRIKWKRLIHGREPPAKRT